MSRTLRIAAWLTWITQVVIVGTGGAVRLTGSGLGCSTWPNCVDGSFTPTPELGIHGIIEFSNRVMGGVTVGVALWLVVLAWLGRRVRRDVLALAATILGLTVLQALIGAFVVWLHLPPMIVGVHFVISVALVAVSTVLVWRVVRGAPDARLGTPAQRILTNVMTLVLAMVVLVGILTTGSGPHAGDTIAARNGLDPQIMQHVHAWPAYALFALTVAVVVLARRGPALHRRFAIGLLALELVQVAVGLIQSETGLPVALVNIHLVLSVLVTAAGTATLLSLRDASHVRPEPRPVSQTVDA